MSQTRSNAIAVAVGLGLAFGLDNLGKRYVPQHRTTAYAALLPAVAAVYPLARSKDYRGPRGLRELIGLGVYSAVAATAAKSNPRIATPTVAAAWATHGVFDLLHDSGKHSRIPSWYPAFCAAYDISLAALLIRSNARQPAL